MIHRRAFVGHLGSIAARVPGHDDPTKAAFPFLHGLALSEAGHEVQIFLLGEAVSLMRASVAAAVVPVGWPPLGEALPKVKARGIQIFACGFLSRAQGSKGVSQRLAGGVGNMANAAFSAVIRCPSHTATWKPGLTPGFLLFATALQPPSGWCSLRSYMSHRNAINIVRALRSISAALDRTRNLPDRLVTATPKR